MTLIPSKGRRMREAQELNDLLDRTMNGLRKRIKALEKENAALKKRIEDAPKMVVVQTDSALLLGYGPDYRQSGHYLILKNSDFNFGIKTRKVALVLVEEGGE